MGIEITGDNKNIKASEQAVKDITKSLETIKELTFEDKNSTHRAKRFVYCSIIKEGFHCYPEAENSPKLATRDMYDVSYLSQRHQHYFTIKLWVEVRHTNRDIEFQQLRRWLDLQFASNALELNNKSCEMISDDLFLLVTARYPGVEVRIDVSEDNINGSYSVYEKIFSR